MSFFSVQMFDMYTSKKSHLGSSTILQLWNCLRMLKSFRIVVLDMNSFKLTSDISSVSVACLVYELLYCVRMLSRIAFSVTPWTAARQAPLSMGFSRQGSWSGLPCPPPISICRRFKFWFKSIFIVYHFCLWSWCCTGEIFLIFFLPNFIS